MDICEEKECSKYDIKEDNNCRRYVDIKQIAKGMCLKMKTEPVSEVPCSAGLEGQLAEWISAKDKLPDRETEHCSTGCNFVDTDGAVFQGYCDWLDSDGEVSWYSYGHRSYMENIAYWMPLPEPPKAA